VDFPDRNSPSASPVKGYVPADSTARKSASHLGLIPVDSLFSPVKKVHYQVEKTPARGQILDYDKAHADQWKPMARSHDNASAYAARSSLQGQCRLQVFMQCEEPGEDEPTGEADKPESGLQSGAAHEGGRAGNGVGAFAPRMHLHRNTGQTIVLTSAICSRKDGSGNAAPPNFGRASR